MALLAAGIVSARAQAPDQAPASGQPQSQGGLDRQLEVTREYTPKVGQAEKLAVEPDMVDTVKLRPDVTYSVTPTASPVSFEVEPYAPATVSNAEWDPSHPFYLRAGIGLPLQSTADLYITPRLRAGSVLGLYYNHRGSFSKLRNDAGFKTDAKDMYNGAGIFGSKQWARYKLEGDLMFSDRRYDMYGTAGPSYFDEDAYEYPRPIEYFFASGDDAVIERLRGRIAFGDTFIDLSKFNFRAWLDLGGAAHAVKQADVNFGVKVSQMFDGGRQGFEATLSERAAVDLRPEHYDDHGNATTVVFAPRYLLRLGNFRLDAGIDLRLVDNKAYDQHYFNIRPAFDISYNVARGRFVPFVSFSSRMIDGSLGALTLQNPYDGVHGVNTGHQAPTGWSGDMRLGFSGNFGGVFSYRLSGGVSDLDKYHIPVMSQETCNLFLPGLYFAAFFPVEFIPAQIDGMLFTVGGEIGLHDVGGFSARLGANWNRIEIQKSYGREGIKGDLPKYDARLELSYDHKNKFKITAGAHLTGDREFMTEYYYDNIDGWGILDKTTHISLDPVVDVSLGAEMKVMHDFWVFVEGRNLANQKLYPIPYYRGLGANVMAGIKVVF